MKHVEIAILGFGIVGSGVYTLVKNNASDYKHREHLDVSVKRALIKDFETEPFIHLAERSLFTLNIDDIANDPSISIVVECIGGTEPAKSFVLKCLNAGKTVVTSNKELIAKHWPELERAAKASGAGLYIEATVGGGIPLLRTINDSLQANNINKVMGIINGTTNYILSGMEETGCEYDEKLKEAQSLGYAEANPASDVEGWDAVYKLSIMGSMAFHARIPIESIYREGITKLSPLDFSNARELGYTIKLLAIGKKTDGKIEARVHPTMIPLKHPLSSVRSAYNAVFINGDAVGDVMLYGAGAGMMPTASAIMGDVLYAAQMKEHRYQTFENDYGTSQTSLGNDWESAFAIRMTTRDQVGVLAQIASAFARHDISLLSVFQQPACKEKASIIFITHATSEQSMQQALKTIDAVDVVASIDSVIRVENSN